MRLTKTMKSEILKKAILISGMGVEYQLICDELQILTLDILHDASGAHDAQIGKIVRNKIATLRTDINEFMHGLPVQIRNAIYVNFSHERAIHVAFAGMEHSLNFNGAFNERVLGHYFERESIEYIYDNVYGATPSYSRGNPLTKRFFAIDRKVVKFNEKFETLKVNLEALLLHANTAKQLIDIWPESAELIPEKNEAKPTLFPVTRSTIDQLNKTIGLPTNGEKTDE